MADLAVLVEDVAKNAQLRFTSHHLSFLNSEYCTCGTTEQSSSVLYVLYSSVQYRYIRMQMSSRVLPEILVGDVGRHPADVQRRDSRVVGRSQLRHFLIAFHELIGHRVVHSEEAILQVLL